MLPNSVVRGDQLLGKGYLASLAFLLVLALFASAPFAAAQGTFSSGSDGSDGAYAPTASGYFDPKQFHGNGVKRNVFNFTTVTIPVGVTITFTPNLDNAPVYWPAAGDVDIEGTRNLNGGNGVTIYLSGVLPWVPAVAGSGGYGGGVGGNSSNNQNATAGRGPGGGAAGCSLAATVTTGRFTGNQYLIPLVGGSGGAGTNTTNSSYPFGSGGGAGGGAILIASSTQITINGTVTAIGGAPGQHDYTCNEPGGGSGGAIRLVSNTIGGTGTLSALGNRVCCNQGGDGRIRLEAYSIGFGGSFSGSPVSESTPNSLFLPTAPPSSVEATSINGTPITENPFTFPDIAINTSSPVPLVITGHQIPLPCPYYTSSRKRRTSKVCNAPVVCRARSTHQHVQ